jgi:hypothetical protein
MSNRNVMAVVTDLVKSGLSVEQTILVNELVMLTASLQAGADRRASNAARMRTVRNGAAQCSTPPIPPRDNIIKIKTPLTPQDQSAFEGFYSAFPKKVGKGSARKAYRNALKRASAEEILAGAKRYAAQRSGQDQQYTAGPAPWLNADRWLDEDTKKAFASGPWKPIESEKPIEPVSPEELAKRQEQIRKAKEALCKKP